MEVFKEKSRNKDEIVEKTFKILTSSMAVVGLMEQHFTSFINDCAATQREPGLTFSDFRILMEGMIGPAWLQGSLKRKQIVNLSPANSKRPNGFVDNSFLDIKRIRVGENLTAGQGGLQVNNGQSHMMSGTLPMSQAPLRKTATLPPHTHSPGNGMFNMGLKEVKKEPGETLSCSKHVDGQVTQENIFSNRYGDDTGEQLMDPELQELFNELTNISVPPMSDLELENMINATIKQDDPFNIDLGQQSQRSTPRPSLPMEKTVIKSEYSPGLTQGPSGSPQLRPSSAGPAFSMATSALSASSPIPSVPQSQAQPQTASGASRALPSWQEVSHAQQLKQIAANRQQHVRMQQHQPTSWPGLPSAAGPSPGPFGQEKIPSPSFGQQPFSPQSSPMPGVVGGGSQSKVMANYIYKASPSAQGGPLDVLLQQKPQDLSRSFMNNPHTAMEPRHGSTKPLFHFNSDQANQQMPSVLPPQNKPPLLHYTQPQPQPQQSSIAAQQQPQQQPPQQQPQPQPQPQPQQQPQPAAQPTQPLSSQPLLRSPLPLQQKILLQKMQNQPITGLGYQVSQQHRQVRAVLLPTQSTQTPFSLVLLLWLPLCLHWDRIKTTKTAMVLTDASGDLMKVHLRHLEARASSL
eukprot:bmy_12466T0